MRGLSGNFTNPVFTGQPAIVKANGVRTAFLAQVSLIDLVELGETGRDFSSGECFQGFLVEVFHAAGDASANEGFRSGGGDQNIPVEFRFIL